MIDYDFREDHIIDVIKDYIDSTYSTHYAGNHAAKAWNRKGILLEASESNIWKYIERFGMKEGHNPKDILKIIHYCIFMLYALEQREGKESDEKTFEDGERESIPSDVLNVKEPFPTIEPQYPHVVEREEYIRKNNIDMELIRRQLDRARIAALNGSPENKNRIAETYNVKENKQ